MTQTAASTTDMRRGLRLFLALDLGVRLFLWATSFAAAIVMFNPLDAWPRTALAGVGWSGASTWGWRLVAWMGLFNVCYLVLLILLRLPIPAPREGRYVVRPGRPIDRQLIWSCLIATLTKARYQPPFPAFMVFHLSNLPPMCWLVGPVLGPRSRSCYVTEPVFADPHLIEVGRNVVFGYGAVISGHAQGRDEITLKRTVIEDDVLIGGNTLIYQGCRIRRGAVVLGGAVVQPDTEIGENEVWGGVPARKITERPPVGATEADPARA